MNRDTSVISHKSGHLLHTEESGGLHRTVREGGGLRWLHFDRRDVQAVIDLAAPDRLLMPYSYGMLAALLFQPAPQNLLNLGLGGGSFERFFNRRQPELRITSVEADEAVIQLARRFFRLPPEHPVVLDDAARFLSRHQGAYDLIFCDIHRGADHPDCLVDADFHADAFRCLKGTGVYVINLLPDGYPHLLNVLTRLRDSFPEVHLLEIPERRNLVIFALKQPPPDAGVLAERAVVLSDRLDLEPGLLRAPQTCLPPRAG